jgi:hypothetical protein
MEPGASRKRSGNFLGSGSRPTHTSELLAFQLAASLVAKLGALT